MGSKSTSLKWRDPIADSEQVAQLKKMLKFVRKKKHKGNAIALVERQLTQVLNDVF